MRFIEWLNPIVPAKELSEENKTKVCIITDLNKAQKLLLGRDMNTTEFDFLYDLDTDSLDTLLFQMKLRVENLQLFNALKGV